MRIIKVGYHKLLDIKTIYSKAKAPLVIEMNIFIKPKIYLGQRK